MTAIDADTHTHHDHHQGEALPVVEAETVPSYDQYWEAFAIAELRRPGSNFPVDRADFLHEATELAAQNVQEYAAVARENPNVYNVNNWYRSLGSFNNMQGAGEDLRAMYNGLLANEGGLRNPSTFMTAGAIVQDLSELAEPDQAIEYLQRGSKLYGHAIKLGNDDMSDPTVRKAKIHWFDTKFQALALEHQLGRVDEDSFNNQYMQLQRRFIGECRQLAQDRTKDVPNGDLYEWYGEAMVRHQIWMKEEMGRFTVRRSLPREDSPYDKLRSKEEPNPDIPNFGFDLKVDTLDGRDTPSYIQLKAHNDEVLYSDRIRVWNYTANENLRAHVDRMTGIMLRSYDFSETDDEQDEIVKELRPYSEPLESEAKSSQE